MIGRTNAGTNLLSSRAAISVMYPKDALCICTDGSRTLKARDSIGYTSFPLNNFGPWRVEIARGGVSKERLVELSAEKPAAQIVMGFSDYIVSGGVVISGVSISGGRRIEEAVGYEGVPCLHLHTGNGAADFVLSGFTVPEYARNLHVSYALLETYWGDASVSFGGSTVSISGDAGINNVLTIPTESLAGASMPLIIHINGGAYHEHNYIRDIWFD